MIDEAIAHEIANYKSQLNEFLALKFIDQSLILGFTSTIQVKYQKWIRADVDKFHSLFLQANNAKQVDTSQCTLIELLSGLWSDIHHPIIKLYQKQHAALFAALMHPTRNGKKNVKVVEMRKLNDLFSKYVKLVKTFYTGIMADVCTNYANPLIPLTYLQEFEINVAPETGNQGDAGAPDFHSTLLYITFLCLLGLGNVTRNWAQIRLAYVEPCKSPAAHFKPVKPVKADKSLGKAHYIFPLLCYSKCVGLLPTMHEPYNHIGVIYNSLGQKFSAILWFLRSQFTRDINVALGRRNLITAFTRPWLEEAYDHSVKKTHDAIEPTDANIILLRIIGDYFYPSAFRKLLYTEKVESDFLAIVFSEPYYGRCVKNTNVFVEHLTVLICFYEFAAQGKDNASRDKFGNFVVKYVTGYLATLKKLEFQAPEAEIPLKNIRLILASVRKNDSFQSLCGPRFLTSLVDAFNAFRGFDSEETWSRIMDSFLEGKAPIRSHYFSEDIHFKDFTPIGCQFKDFDDTHLFSSGNIHLLFGSYFYENVQGVPEFLDNEAVLRINKEVELASGDKLSHEKAIAAECSRSENISRLQASVVLAKRIFGSRIHLDSEREAFEVETLNVPKTQRKAGEKAPRKKTKAKKSDKADKAKSQLTKEVLLQSEERIGDRLDDRVADRIVDRVSLPAPSNIEARKPSLQVTAALPSSIEEIELMILGHAPKLVARAQEPDTDAGLADMVLAIVSEDESRDTLTTSGEAQSGLSSGVLSKSTESSRVESALTADCDVSSYSSYGPTSQHPPQLLRNSSNNMSHDKSAYQPGFPVAQDASAMPSSFMQAQQHQYQQYQQHPQYQQYQQYQQPWYTGVNGTQNAPFPANGMPPNDMASGAVPPNAFHSTPMAQNGTFYPGVPQNTGPQPMAPVPGNSYFPQPFMMPQYPPNMMAQNSQGSGQGSGSSYPDGNTMYSQYSSQ